MALDGVMADAAMTPFSLMGDTYIAIMPRVLSCESTAAPLSSCMAPSGLSRATYFHV